MARSRNLVDSTSYCVLIGWLSFTRIRWRIRLKGMLRLNVFLPLSTNFRKLLNHQMECFTNLLLERPSVKGTWIAAEVFCVFMILIFHSFGYISYSASICHLFDSLNHKSIFINFYSSLGVVT